MEALPEGDPLRKTLTDFDGKVDAVRKQIVATTEGGAITGEERLREHTDQLYGAILSYEGKPGDYLIANIDTLKRTLDEVTKEFEQVNDEGSAGGERSAQGGRQGAARRAAAEGRFRRRSRRAPALARRAASLPANFRLLH